MTRSTISLTRGRRPGCHAGRLVAAVGLSTVGGKVHPTTQSSKGYGPATPNPYVTTINETTIRAADPKHFAKAMRAAVAHQASKATFFGLIKPSAGQVAQRTRLLRVALGCTNSNVNGGHCAGALGLYMEQQMLLDYLCSSGGVSCSGPSDHLAALLGT